MFYKYNSDKHELNRSRERVKMEKKYHVCEDKFEFENYQNKICP